MIARTRGILENELDMLLLKTTTKYPYYYSISIYVDKK